MPQRKSLNIRSTSSIKDLVGVGRDSRTWVIFDNSRLLMIVILPIGIRNLGLHILTKSLMFPILLLIFKFVISAILLTSNWIPKDINLFVKSRSRFWLKVVPLSLHAPILATLGFLRLSVYQKYDGIHLKPAYIL